MLLIGNTYAMPLACGVMEKGGGGCPVWSKSMGHTEFG